MHVHAKASVWHRKLLDILSDGEWHDYEQLIQECAPMVPPGLAWRKAEQNRLKYYEREKREAEPRHYGDRTNTILTGQRAVIQRALVNIRKQRRMDTEYQDIPNSKRLRPTRIRLIKPAGGWPETQKEATALLHSVSENPESKDDDGTS